MYIINLKDEIIQKIKKFDANRRKVVDKKSYDKSHELFVEMANLFKEENEMSCEDFIKEIKKINCKLDIELENLKDDNKK